MSDQTRNPHPQSEPQPNQSQPWPQESQNSSYGATGGAEHGAYGQPPHGQNQYGEPPRNQHDQPGYGPAGYGHGPNDPHQPQQKKSKTGLIIGICTGVVLLAGLVFGGIFFFNKMNEDKKQEQNVTQQDKKPENEKENQNQNSNQNSNSNSNSNQNNSNRNSNSNQNSNQRSNQNQQNSGDRGGLEKEREAFFKEQQLVPGRDKVAPKTSAHRAFLNEIKSKNSSPFGAQWGEGVEANLLALGLDACEASILNSHKISPSLIKQFAAGVPAVQNVLRDLGGDRNAVTEEAMQYAVLGTKHICKRDHSAWEKAYKEVSPNWTR
ncbi:MAG: hypothetical protein Q4C71_05395 [Microbacteriaceae bacterium]|nr:hypothetical protein [Microbacteriaceae bacterium]